MGKMTKTKGTKKHSVPRRPYDKDRFIAEMKLVGDYGLRNKKELWSAQFHCDSLKKKASQLLITNDKDEFIVRSRALLNFLNKIGIFKSEINFSSNSSLRSNLEEVLDLTVNDFLERRLQTRVVQLGLAKSVHHARKLITQRKILVNQAVVDKPSFILYNKSEAFVEAVEAKSSINEE